MKGQVWEVEYELKKFFTSEKTARRFYKKTAARQDLKVVKIRHRIHDNAERIGIRDQLVRHENGLGRIVLVVERLEF